MSSISLDLPAWMSIIPPLVAILAALLFREVISALLLSVISGGLLIGWSEGGWSGVLEGLLIPVDYVLHAVTPSNGDSGHISVILFSLMIGGMVAVITANGSMQSLVQRIGGKATTKKRGQFVTWLMGVLIFFDDYANTMIVGNTMRPLTDRLKISREKLAYIVDSTAAPVAAMALVTTWIGAELLYISDGIKELQHFPADFSAYRIFLSSLEYMYYPLLTLAFILIIIWTGKDFGPMLQAERNNKVHVEVESTQVLKAPIWKGIVPILIMLFGTIIALWTTGYSDEIWHRADLGFTRRLGLVISAADSFKALLWGSYSAITIAVLISLPQLGLEKAIGAAMKGFKKMLPAIIILILAWALAGVTETLHTAGFISSTLSGNVSSEWMPFLTFIVSGLIAFSTGSSWGTMAILYPVIIGTTWTLGVEAGMDTMANYSILANTVACVLAGSVLGDHCSPISDTTILSSIASECDHLAHVKTQLPYALTVGLVSLFCGTVLSTMGVPFLVCILVSLALLYGIVSYFGQRSL